MNTQYTPQRSRLYRIIVNGLRRGELIAKLVQNGAMQGGHGGQDCGPTADDVGPAAEAIEVVGEVALERVQAAVGGRVKFLPPRTRIKLLRNKSKKSLPMPIDH